RRLLRARGERASEHARQHPTEGDERRLVPVRGELLPALPPRRAHGAADRHVDLSPRFSLRDPKLRRRRVMAEMISILANPKQARLDRWASLRDALNRSETATGDARASHIRTALAGLRALRPFERLWLYPGDARLGRLQQALEAGDAARAAAHVRTMVRLL